MKRTFLLLLVVLVATWSLASANYIGLYGDAEAVSCGADDVVPGLFTIYAVASLSEGTLGVEFSAPMPACMVGAVHVGDAAVYPVTLGDSQEGVGIAFGECTVGQVHVYTINYYGSGTSGPCCLYPLLGFSGNPLGPRRTDCGAPFPVAYPFPGLPVIVNTGVGCSCVVPVETSTWGAIKSMYE